MANEYLKRTATSTGNRRTWTLALWLKRNIVESDPGTDVIFNAANTAANSHGTDIRFRKDNNPGGNNGWNFYDYNNNAFTWGQYSDVARMDPGNWFHAIFVFNSTADLDGDRVRVYINGVLDNEYIASPGTFPTLDYESYVNSITEHYIGIDQFGGSLTTSYSKSQFADIFLVDGQALTPDVFGFHKEGKGYESSGSTKATDFRPGQWSPHSPRKIKTEIERKGGFGVNGFYLPMNDSSNPGADFHCTPNSIITLKGEDLPQPRNGAPTTSDAYVSQLRSDPYASNIVLAIPGIAGGQGSGYGDYSADIKGSGSNKTITATGDAGISATASYYGSALSFDGSGDYLETTLSAFGTNDFTIEYWINPNSISASYTGTVRLTASTGAKRIEQAFQSSTLQIYTDTGAWRDTGFAPPTNQWTHIALEKYNGYLTVYANGVAVWTVTNTRDYDESFNVDIGNHVNSLNGYMQDIRVYSGAAKYKGGFDVPKPYIPVGIESWRQVTDTCKNNFATLSPLGGNGTLSDGNLTVTAGGIQSRNITFATPGNGKWYAEFRTGNVQSGTWEVLGIHPINKSAGPDRAYAANGQFWNGSAWGNFGGAWSNGDIIGIAYNQDDNQISFYRNGSLQGSTQSYSSSESHYFVARGNTGSIFNCNFGQNPTFGNIAALNKNRINSSTADSVWHQSSNTGTHTDWTVSSGGTELDVAVPSGHYARVKLRSADGTIDPKKKYLLSFKYTTGPANLGVQNDQGYMTAVDGSVSPNGLSSGNFYSFIIHGTSEVSITGFTGSTYALDTVVVSEIDECYTDDSGKGKFHYQPPTGYLALCEDNLPTPAIADPGDHFKTVLYTGDGTSGRSINVGFKPDLIWLKNRTGANWHLWYDSVRGPGNSLYSNVFNDEDYYDSLLSFDSNGFSVKHNSNVNSVNISGGDIVAWCWKAGGTAVTNTDGTITSQVSANQVAGFSVVSWTSDGTSLTVGHGLNKVPSLIIQKQRDADANWTVYHKDLAATEIVKLDTDGEKETSSDFANTRPTSSVLSSFTTGVSGRRIIAYCWAEIPGYSKIGTYTGNGNANGPFVYCGFKPAWVMAKNVDDTGGRNWGIQDSSRASTNPCDKHLKADSSEVENSGLAGSTFQIDLLSNGFKVRNNTGIWNNNGETIIFMAFAESPFQTANAK